MVLAQKALPPPCSLRIVQNAPRVLLSTSASLCLFPRFNGIRSTTTAPAPQFLPFLAFQYSIHVLISINIRIHAIGLAPVTTILA